MSGFLKKKIYISGSFIPTVQKPKILEITFSSHHFSSHATYIKKTFD